MDNERTYKEFLELLGNYDCDIEFVSKYTLLYRDWQDEIKTSFDSFSSFLECARDYEKKMEIR